MASGFFAILDDIAALMDDVALTTKIATRKTAGILGDDLAVNAEKATGFVSSRELPVLWAITKASFLNKLIIIPVAFLLTVFLPLVITIILVLGGLYLAYEGCEKIVSYFRGPSVTKPAIASAAAATTDNADEQKKIKSAVLTDFILSVEIVIISIGTVIEKDLPIQIITVCIVALLATVGVYGLVALIVRMDDAGTRLIKGAGDSKFRQQLGKLLVNALPVVIKLLSFIGTIALLLVSGGLLIHQVGFLHQLVPPMPAILQELLVGLLAGGIVFLLVSAFKKTFFFLQSAFRRN